MYIHLGLLCRVALKKQVLNKSQICFAKKKEVSTLKLDLVFGCIPAEKHLNTPN
jgi:hypothetical protein